MQAKADKHQTELEGLTITNQKLDLAVKEKARSCRKESNSSRTSGQEQSSLTSVCKH